MAMAAIDGIAFQNGQFPTPQLARGEGGAEGNVSRVANGALELDEHLLAGASVGVGPGRVGDMVQVGRGRSREAGQENSANHSR